MSDKPSYLGLLNALSLAETRAGEYLSVWVDTTPNPDVRRVLVTVAARESEHGLAFAKRIVELGYELRHKDDPGQQQRMDVAASTEMSDLEKMECFGLHELESSVLGFLDGIFKDHTIDIQTGALLGRYIAEEHDTGRLVRSCYEQLKAAGSGAAAGVPVAVEGRLAALDAKVDALCATVEQLCALVATPADERTESNGRSKARSRS
jgi:hypothetical protein